MLDVKNIALSIVNKVNYKKVMHFSSQIPYMVLFITIYGIGCLHFIDRPIKTISVQAMGIKETIISNLTTFSL